MVGNAPTPHVRQRVVVALQIRVRERQVPRRVGRDVVKMIASGMEHFEPADIAELFESIQRKAALVWLNKRVREKALRILVNVALGNHGKVCYLEVGDDLLGAQDVAIEIGRGVIAREKFDRVAESRGREALIEVVDHELHDTISLERAEDRKSTRLNSSHGYISYAVFCLKKKNTQQYVQIAAQQVLVGALAGGRRRRAPRQHQVPEPRRESLLLRHDRTVHVDVGAVGRGA